MLPSLKQRVWVGLSAGSMVMAHPDLPHNTLAKAQRWTADIAGPAYAIDDDTASQGGDGAVEVVSECTWKFFAL